MPVNPYIKGGTDVPVVDGGTGASNAAGARTNLMALDETAHDLLDHSGLTGIGDLTTAAHLLIDHGTFTHSLLNVGTTTDAVASGDFSTGLTGGNRLTYDASASLLQASGNFNGFTQINVANTNAGAAAAGIISFSAENAAGMVGATSAAFSSSGWKADAFNVIATSAAPDGLWLNSAGADTPIDLATLDTARWRVLGNGSGNHFIAVADNTYDIGASGTTRPRSAYIGTNVLIGTPTSPPVVAGSLAAGVSGRYLLFDGSDGELAVRGTGRAANFNSDAPQITNDSRAVISVVDLSTSDVTGTGPAIQFNSTHDPSGGYEQAAIGGYREAGGSTVGQTPCSLALLTQGNTNPSASALTIKWRILGAGHLIAHTDNTYDIGASGATRPRTVYAGTSLEITGLTAAGDPISIAGVANGNQRIVNRNTSTGTAARAQMILGADGGDCIWQVIGSNGATNPDTALISSDSALSGGLRLGTNGTFPLTLTTNTLARWTVDGTDGHFVASTDNTYDIGASGATRPRRVYVGTEVIVGNTITIDSSSIFAADGTSAVGGDLFMFAGAGDAGFRSGRVFVCAYRSNDVLGQSVAVEGGQMYSDSAGDLRAGAVQFQGGLAVDNGTATGEIRGGHALIRGGLGRHDTTALAQGGSVYIEAGYGFNVSDGLGKRNPGGIYIGTASTETSLNSDLQFWNGDTIDPSEIVIGTASVPVTVPGGIANSGALTLTSGNGDFNTTVTTGNNGAGDSGDISIAVGTATGTAGVIGIGETNATAVNISRSGVTTTVGGDLTVSGNLTVNGTTTTVDTTNLLVEDVLAIFAANATTGDEAGLAFERGSTGDDALILWNEVDDRFELGLFDTSGGTTAPTGALTNLSPLRLGDALTQVAANGVTTGVLHASAVVDFSVSGTASGLIPAGALILGVTSRILTTVSGGGATDISTGDGVDVDRWGTAGALTAGTTINPTTYGDNTIQFNNSASAADVVVSGVGGTPTAGTVRLTVAYMLLTAPTS